TLLELAEHCTGRFAMAPLGMFSRRWSLEERVSGILSPDRIRSTRASRVPLAAITLLLAASCVLVGGAGAPAKIARQPDAKPATQAAPALLAAPQFSDAPEQRSTDV